MELCGLAHSESSSCLRIKAQRGNNQFDKCILGVNVNRHER